MIYNVLQYLEHSAQVCPQKTAVADELKSYTYLEYQQLARRIASWLLPRLGGARNQPIAVRIDRNADSLAAFLAVVYTGNFYVPLDSSMPRERIQLIFDTLRPAAVVDAQQTPLDLPGEYVLSRIPGDLPIDEEALARIRRDALDTDPLYAIFTSGSTGVPKGVVIAHRGVIDLVGAFQEAFGFHADQVFGNQAPFDFDVSVKDIYNAMALGATVQIIPRKLFRLPKLLVSYLQERSVNTLIWAVSALRMISDFKALENGDPLSMEYVMFSGEVMPIRALNYWMDHVPGARYVNLYGPTEITCNCTYYEVTRRFAEDQSLPIGRAFRNTRVMLRSQDGSWITSENQIGEICVMGSCLGLGYWNNPGKTQEAFCRNQSITAYDSRMYATGDLGYYGPEGEIMFASRKDFQIKHMGHRIELGEIETALNAIPFLTISCCVYDAPAEKIVCFYESAEECKKDIVMALSRKLPKYMWPNRYIHMDALPMNKNGKIDRPLLLRKAAETDPLRRK